MAKRFIRLPETLNKAGVQKSKLWDMVKKEEFPQPIKLSPGTTVWIEEEVNQWIEDKISECRGDDSQDAENKKPTVKRRIRKKTGGAS